MEVGAGGVYCLRLGINERRGGWEGEGGSTPAFGKGWQENTNRHQRCVRAGSIFATNQPNCLLLPDFSQVKQISLNVSLSG